MARACTVCEHEERLHIDAALVGGRSLRDIARTFELSVSAVHRHQSRGHVAEAMQATANRQTAPSDTPTWIHVDAVGQLLEAVREVLPDTRTRSQLLDRLKDEELRPLLNEALLAGIPPEDIADARRLRNGLALVMHKGCPEWFGYFDGAFRKATPEQIAEAGLEPRLRNEAQHETAHPKRDTQLEGAQ